MLGKSYVDIDFVKSHPSIICALAESFECEKGIPTIIGYVRGTLDISKTQASILKVTFLSLMNGKSIAKAIQETKDVLHNEFTDDIRLYIERFRKEINAITFMWAKQNEH
jgi:hypothetical protein